MKYATFTPGRLLSRRALGDPDGPEPSESTPKGATSRGANIFRTALSSSLKGRHPALHDIVTTMRKRPASIAADVVKVFVRAKPVMEVDLKHGRSTEALYVDERDGKRGVAVTVGEGKENWFCDFDGVLDDATNQQVFDAVCGNLLQQYLSGYNVSVMAYGQTGSGKTYSMFGGNEPGAQVQGLLQLALNRVEEHIVSSGVGGARLAVSVLEVYNEELFSLLDEQGVERRHLVKGMVDLSHHRPKCLDRVSDAIELIPRALHNRARDATARNATSSRSHAVVRLRLERAPAGHEGQWLVSTMFLVDLAGSESYHNAANGTQQRETICINSSLNALERVVNSLANGSLHVPYRDSLLTQVLQDGLNPSNAKVALLTTVSRFQNDVPVTKSTLLFAQRARNIRTFAQVNLAPKKQAASCPEETHRQLQEMQAINHALRQRLADLETNHERQTRERDLDAIRAMREELARLGEVHAELQRSSACHQTEAEAALEAERAAHAATRERICELQRRCNQLQREAEVAAGEARAAAELRGQLAERAVEVARLHGELAGHETLVAEVAAQKEAVEEQLAVSREQLMQLKGQLAVAEAGNTNHQAELERQLVQLRAEAAAASDLAAAEAAALQQHLQHQLTERDQLVASQVADLAAIQAQLDLKNLSSASQVAAMQAQLAERDKLTTRQAAELAAARNHLEEREQLLAHSTEELAAVQGQLAEREQLLAHQAQQLAAMQLQLAERDELVAHHSAELATAQEQLQAQQIAMCEAAAHQEASQQELQLMRQQLQAAEQRAGQQAYRVRMLLSHLTAARDSSSSVEGLADALQAAEAVAQELGRQVSTAQAEALLGYTLWGRSCGPEEGMDVDSEVEGVRSNGGGKEGAVRTTQQRLQDTLEQLQICTGQLAALEEELSVAREQLVAVEAAKGTAAQQLAAAREADRAEIVALRQQLLEQTAVLSRQAAAHSAALAAAVQDARSTTEAAAAERLVPLQTECERLRATCSLSEQQLARLQTECERLRSEGGEATEQVARLTSQCERLRERAQKAEGEAAERAARLESLAERDAAPRPDTLKQLQERIRQLELERKRSEANQKGQLELKDKLIHQLELMNNQLQAEMGKLRANVAAAPPASTSDHPGCTTPHHVQPNGRSDVFSPVTVDDTTPSQPVSRGPSGGGILLTNRTTTGSAAALARNTRAFRPDLFTTPHAQRPTSNGQFASSTPVINLVTPTPSMGGSAMKEDDLLANETTPGPLQPSLAPSSSLEEMMDDGDGLVVVLRENRERRANGLRSSTNSVMNRMNY